MQKKVCLKEKILLNKSDGSSTQCFLNNTSENSFLSPGHFFFLPLVEANMSAEPHVDDMCCLSLRIFVQQDGTQQLVWQEFNEMLYLNKISWYLGFQGVYNASITKARL